MPRPVASYTRPPVDPVRLKAAADRLADLLNDLRAEDWHLHASGSREWSILQAPGGVHSAKAVVTERTDGRWETSEVSDYHRLGKPSLAERLRALAAEVEALNATPGPAGPCGDRSWAHRHVVPMVTCVLKAGHEGPHVAAVYSPFEQFTWTSVPGGRCPSRYLNGRLVEVSCEHAAGHGGQHSGSSSEDRFHRMLWSDKDAIR